METENALIDRFEIRDVSLSEKRLREELCRRLESLLVVPSSRALGTRREVGWGEGEERDSGEPVCGREA